MNQGREERFKYHAAQNDNYIVIFIVNTFRFYIGCDLCTNWYHGECVGITEKEAKKMDVYICNDCKRAQEGSSEELYCICRTPYDESQWVLIRASYLIMEEAKLLWVVIYFKIKRKIFSAYIIHLHYKFLSIFSLFLSLPPLQNLCCFIVNAWDAVGGNVV